MDIKPQLFFANVMHKRLFPKVNQFTYGLYYIALPLPAQKLPSRVLSFCNKDHGARDGSDVKQWAESILESYGLHSKVHNIVLITMPRVLGYVFNPVSFFMCLDQNKQLRAVICEVHNTFGEQHTYLCARPDFLPLSPDEWLESDKLFHVSPFLERSGQYKFRFALAGNKLGIWIDYFDKQQNKQLITSLTGTLAPLTTSSLRSAFWRYPIITLTVIMLIHWQALQLFLKGIRYIVKPTQLSPTISTTHNLTKS